jgi:hypothetical protein
MSVGFMQQTARCRRAGAGTRETPGAHRRSEPNPTPGYVFHADSTTESKQFGAGALHSVSSQMAQPRVCDGDLWRS